MKNKKLLFAILLTFLFLATFSFTYAYFSLGVFGNDEAKDIMANTGTLSIVYTDGPEVVAQEIYPGWSITKTFTVENTGSLDAYYSLNWDEITNTITNDELVMSMSCTGSGCKTITQETVGNVTGPFVAGILIKPGITHTYTITFNFLEMSRAQDYNQGKVFTGVINVEESSDSVAMYGTLVDSSDTPIPNATITLHSNPQTTTTDSNGNFVFNNVEISNHTLSASKDGTELLNDTLVINNGTTNAINNTTITKTQINNEIKIKIKLGNDKTIEKIEEVNYTLSRTWATTLGITQSDILAIPVENTIDSPETYTYKGVTYNRNKNGIDVSENSDGSVLASTYTNGEKDVIVMINSRGKTSLPEDSNFLFSDIRGKSFKYLECIQTENFNTSKVTNMYGMFSGLGEYATTFNIGDLSNWDTSQVTTMNHMFNNVGRNANFNVDLSTWDTSQVTDMYCMFYNVGENAQIFDIDLSTWDTSQVTNMQFMFDSAGKYATTFNIGDLSNWDTSKVKSMSYMFMYAGYNATTWSIGDLSNWNTSKVLGMQNMFMYAGYNATTWSIGELSNWDTSQVTNMQFMLHGTGGKDTTFNIGDLSNWDTSKVTSMSTMFEAAGYNATTWSIGDLSDWDTSQVTNMSNMFYNTGGKDTTFNIGDLSNWDTSKVTDMNNMFSFAGKYATTFNLDLSRWNWDTSQVTDMNSMFSYAGYYSINFDLKLSDLNTTKVTNMSNMFSNAGYNATTFNLDLSNWDTSKVTSMQNMFYNAGKNATTFSLNLSGWDTSKVTNANEMFSYAGCNSTSTLLNIKGFNLNSSNTILTDYVFMFFAMNSNAQITVGSTDSRDWILGFDYPFRPSEWTESNFTVDITP